MNKRIPKQFELPTIYWPRAEAAHYTPPKARDERIIAARRLLPPGTLVLAQQLHGIRIAALMLGRVTTREDLAFTSSVLSAAAFGSAGYTYGLGAREMRRNVPLPVQINPETNERKTDFDRSLDASEALVTTMITGNVALREKVLTHKLRRDTARMFGRTAAQSALYLSLVPHFGLASCGSSPDIHQAVREIGMDALESARDLSDTIGTYPSYAQLADPYSDLVVHIHKHAPTAVVNALEFGQEAAIRLAA